MIKIAEQQSLNTDLHELIQTLMKVRVEDINERAMETARHSLLDWLGCAVAGANDAAAQRFLEVLTPAPGQSSVVGFSETVSWRDAAVLNGFFGHFLDFDDMLPSFSGHPSTVVLPALLVVAEHSDTRIDELLRALIIGVEVGNWVASKIMPGHYDAGWHATGTIGAFAAAAAVCCLQKLDFEQWISSLDIAATQSAGLRALFGTLAKPLHAGNSAQAGILAARLSEITKTSGHGLTGKQGFIANYCGSEFEATSPSNNFAIEGMLYKTYASCFMTQASVDAGTMLRSTDLNGAEVHITVSPKLQGVCTIEDPQTSTDAKFSLHATFALAYLGHDLSREDAFSVENLKEESFLDLGSRTFLHFDPNLAGTEPRIHVEVKFPDGSKLVETIDRGEPAHDLSLRAQQLDAKFTQLTSPFLGTEKTDGLRSLVLWNNEKTITDLYALTR